MLISDLDKNIIKGCLKGQANAWEKFTQRFSGLVKWSIKTWLDKYGYSYTASDTEDIAQEVFLSLYHKNKLKQLKDTSRIAPWLSIIAGNAAVNYMERVKGKIAMKSISLFEETDSELTIADTLESNAPDIRQEIDEKLKQEILLKEIERLNPKERLMLSLFFIYRNTISEIAKHLNMPQGTVSTTINRIKERLRQKYFE